MAIARKLVVIAWHMLTANEPYRYASPRTTANKLGALRIAATASVVGKGSPGARPPPSTTAEAVYSGSPA